MSLNTLNHLGLIMDGNGRWALQRSYSRTRGHVKGAKKAFEIIRFVDDLGSIKYLSLFAFSTENWGRPESEVCSLLRLVSLSLSSNLEFFLKRNIRIRIIGLREKLPETVIESIELVESKTAACAGLNLNIFINYSGRIDLVQAINRMIQSGKAWVTSTDIDQFLMTSDFADPDIIIRTGNENRLSNFFLWQAAYSEVYFDQKLWPDFKTSDLWYYIEKFSSTQRRFGKV